MYGKLIFPILFTIKINTVNIGRYCTHGAFIWLIMTWKTSPTKSSWRVAVFIEMSLEDLRCDEHFFFWFVEEPFPKQAMSRWSSLRKPQVAEPQTQNPGVFSVQNDEKVSPRCFKTGIFWGYTTVRHRLCRTNLMLSWCLFRFSLINSFLLWHCEIGVFICI